MHYVLGIESSCDETAVAIYDAEKGIVGHVIHSQIPLHHPYGGVVPELASRDHVVHLTRLVEQTLAESGVSVAQLDAIAYTAGPGLVGALLVGASFAKSLALSLNIPAIAVHHLEAHVLAAMLDDPSIKFPCVALLVSGGHTQLIEARALGSYRLLGETLDDAVGEAFDKTAKCMGLPYPGGPQISALAARYEARGCSNPFHFPQPMLDRPGLMMSFSGLKTHAWQAWQKSSQDDLAKEQIAHAFQTAVVAVLQEKCARALALTGHTQWVVAGGVGANQALRQALTTLSHRTQTRVYYPRLAYCTDNGAMIAYAGFLYGQLGQCDETLEITVRPKWPLTLS